MGANYAGGYHPLRGTECGRTKKKKKKKKDKELSQDPLISDPGK